MDTKSPGDGTFRPPPPQLAALMDPFAASPSFLHAVFSGLLHQLLQASADSVSPFPPGRIRVCCEWRGGGGDTRRSGRLKG